MLKKAVVGALAVAAGVACAVGTGDVLSFAAGGGLHRVTLVRALSETSFAGTLDGYADTLNATVVATADGWVMDVDDWKAGCAWNVVRDAAGLRGTCQAKPRRPRRACRTLPRSAADAAAGVAGLRKIVVGGGWTAGWTPDPVTNEVDILVVYDQTARAWLASTGRTPQAYAESQIAKMNLALANSGLADTFAVTLAGVFNAEVDVTRDCGTRSDSYLEKALGNMAGESSLPKWRAIRDARERTGADIVMMLADSEPDAVTLDDISGTVGISAAFENDSAKGLYGLVKSEVDDQREQAYGVCNIRITAADNTFGHEAGHIMGAGHSDLLSPDYSQPGPQLFPYSSAWMYRDVNGSYYYTIMGYDSTDGEDASPTYAEIPYYSSPALAHPVTGTALGDDAHDNVRTLRATYAIVSQFRVNAARRTAPIAPAAGWAKARTLVGVVAEDGVPTGLVQLRVGRLNARTGTVRVSGSLTGCDGRRRAFAGVKAKVVDDAVRVELAARGGETLTAVVSSAGIRGLACGEAVWLAGATAGGALAQTAPVFALDSAAPAALAADLAGLQAQLLPMEEPFAATDRRWTFARAARVTCARGAETGLSVDTSRGRTNLSGLKLTYAPRTGLFRGSFRAYALVEGRGRPALRKYTVRVTGIVADGKGFAQAVVARPAAGPVAATIE
jgi:hypothetical protein